MRSYGDAWRRLPKIASAKSNLHKCRAYPEHRPTGHNRNYGPFPTDQPTVPRIERDLSSRCYRGATTRRATAVVAHLRGPHERLPGNRYESRVRRFRVRTATVGKSIATAHAHDPALSAECSFSSRLFRVPSGSCRGLCVLRQQPETAAKNAFSKRRDFQSIKSDRPDSPSKRFRSYSPHESVSNRNLVSR